MQVMKADLVAQGLTKMVLWYLMGFAACHSFDTLRTGLNEVKHCRGVGILRYAQNDKTPQKPKGTQKFVGDDKIRLIKIDYGNISESYSELNN